MNPKSQPICSIVIPVYNEEDNILELHQRLCEVLDALPGGIEFIFIDDGSHDGTLALLQKICEKDLRVQILSFARNFGHQAAITAGLKSARGRAVIVMDADFQDPPELIPLMIQKWREGFQVVYARRKRREKESWSKRASAALYYKILSRLAHVNIPRDTGDFCLMDRQVVDVLNAMPERNRYVRGLRAWAGFRQTEILFDRPSRLKGSTKYTFLKSMSLAADGVISFSYIPLRVAFYLGFVSVVIGFAAFFTGQTILLTVLFFVGGIQLLCLGVLGEYLGRIYDEVRQRPLYVLKEINPPGNL